MFLFDIAFLNSHISGNGIILLGERMPGIRFLLLLGFSEVHPLYFFLLKCSWLGWGYWVGTFSVWWFARVVFPLALLTNVLHTMWSVKGSLVSAEIAHSAVERFSRHGRLVSKDGNDLLSSPLSLSLGWHSLAQNRSPSWYGLKAYSDIVYATPEELAEAGPVESEYMKLDVYVKKENDVGGQEEKVQQQQQETISSPSGVQRKRLLPVILYIHGGAWTKGAGHKGNNVPMPLMLAQQGWIAVSINYRLFPDNVFPTFIIDCKRALRWVKENIESYGGDPNFIVVSGGSAGGHLASLLALSGPIANTQIANPHCRDWQPGFEDMDLTVQGSILWYPACDTGLEWWSRFTKKPFDPVEHCKASPYHMLRNMQTKVHDHSTLNICPTLIIQPSQDQLVPAYWVAGFYRQLRKVARLTKRDSHLFDYVEFHGAHHAFDQVISARTIYACAVSVRYARQLYEEHLEATEQVPVLKHQVSASWGSMSSGSVSTCGSAASSVNGDELGVGAGADDEEEEQEREQQQQGKIKKISGAHRECFLVPDPTGSSSNKEGDALDIFAGFEDVVVGMSAVVVAMATISRVRSMFVQ